MCLEQKHITLNFAMNGGMYKKDGSPQGLYIEEGKMLAPITVNNNPADIRATVSISDHGPPSAATARVAVLIANSDTPIATQAMLNLFTKSLLLRRSFSIIKMAAAPA